MSFDPKIAARYARQLLKSVAAVAVLSTAAIALEAPGISGDVFAQEDNAKKRRSQVMRNDKLIKTMQTAYKRLETEEYTAALADLQRAPADTELSSYERAKLNEFKGSLYAQTEQYDQAINAYQRFLKEPDAPVSGVSTIRFNLAQLYMVKGDFKTAITLLEDWRKTAESVTASNEYLFCQAYLSVERYKTALKPCQAALSKADAEGMERREGWVVANVVAYQQTNQLEPATELMKWLLVNHPKEQYWKQLSGFYSQRGLEKDEVAAFEIAYLQGFLNTESELKRLAQLYQFHGMPIRAAEVIETGIKAEVIKRSKEIEELLGNSYQLARELDDAKRPLAAAAQIGNDGKLWERVAQLYIQAEQWDRAADALKKAQRAGGLSDPLRVKIYEGMSLTYSGKYTQARTVFNAARKLADTDRERKSINGWMRFVDDSKRRADERKKFGIKPFRS